MKLGDRIKELRSNSNISQKKLAEELTIPVSTLANYENNHRNPDFDTLEKIADYFNVTVDYLIGRTDLKTFDEYVFHTDFKDLSEQYKKANSETQKIVTNIFDHVFLSVFHNIGDNNIELLTKLEKMYYCIYKVNVDLESNNKALVLNEIVGFDVTMVQDKIKILSKYKNKLNALLDELLEYYITGNNNQGSYLR